MGFIECNHLRAKLFTLHTISDSSKQMALEVVELLKCQENKPSLRPSLWHGAQQKVSILSPRNPPRKRLNVCRCRVLLTNWRNFRWQHTRLYLVYKIKLHREIFSVVQRKAYQQKVQRWLLMLYFLFFLAPVLSNAFLSEFRFFGKRHYLRTVQEWSKSWLSAPECLVATLAALARLKQSHQQIPRSL